VTNFLIMMTFLSGTFYLVDKLPEPFRSASHFNPFFYLIDGFRYGLHRPCRRIHRDRGRAWAS
jgi:ABC-2 type transport system permease protein